jgi:hypothetical protein
LENREPSSSMGVFRPPLASATTASASAISLRFKEICVV